MLGQIINVCEKLAVTLMFPELIYPLPSQPHVRRDDREESDLVHTSDTVEAAVK